MRERLDYLASLLMTIKHAVANDETLKEESVDVLPEEWNLGPDEFLLITQYLKRNFTSSAWLIVEKA